MDDVWGIFSHQIWKNSEKNQHILMYLFSYINIGYLWSHITHYEHAKNI
jgi:hypothetical protein